MQTVEALVKLTFEDLRQELERIRGNMPTRTLYHWLNRLDLIPNSEAGWFHCECRKMRMD